MRDFKAVAFFVIRLIDNGFERGKMNRSIKDIADAALVVSHFSLEHNTSSSKRLEFFKAANPDEENNLSRHFNPHNSTALGPIRDFKVLL